MKPIDGIIRHYTMIKEGSLAQRKYFLDPKITTRGNWYMTNKYSLI